MASRSLWVMFLVGGALATPLSRALAQATPPMQSLVPSTRKSPSKSDVPASHMPPVGMCRVWLDNVPPAQQPAPTDCPSAIRNRPPNGRVIFPEDARRGKRDEKGENRDRKDSKPKKPFE